VGYGFTLGGYQRLGQDVDATVTKRASSINAQTGQAMLGNEVHPVPANMLQTVGS
jgi:hypothetical protein